jgi:hypothetical protein
MTRRPGLFNEALAGFFRSTEATARKRAEAAAAAAAPKPPGEPSPLTVPVPPDEKTDIDWLADTTRSS